MMKNNYIEIGKVVNTFGIKGELKIVSESDFVDYRYAVGKTIFLKMRNSVKEVKVSSYRIHKGNILITIDDLKDINLVESYIGCDVLADKDDVDTLIFDEIDTGISGRAADKVGLQLQNVANSRQVICVTHLAQIAAYAQNHLLIEKSVSNDRTFTNVISLDYESQIREIARIMSGSDLTQNLYNSAKELLDRSKK